MLKIRLSQTGTKNRKSYRIVAIEEGKRSGGKNVEVLGFIIHSSNQLKSKLTKRVEYWVFEPKFQIKSLNFLNNHERYPYFYSAKTLDHPEDIAVDDTKDR
jgi:hypothetical protein